MKKPQVIETPQLKMAKAIQELIKDFEIETGECVIRLVVTRKYKRISEHTADLKTHLHIEVQ